MRASGLARIRWVSHALTPEEIHKLELDLLKAAEAAVLWREVAHDLKECLRNPAGLQEALEKFRQARKLQPVEVSWRCLDRLMPHPDRGTKLDVVPLEQTKHLLFKQALDAYEGNVSEAARALGVSRATFYRYVRSHLQPAKDRKPHYN